MSNGTDPNTNFGRSDGVDLRSYFETILGELRNDYKERVSEMDNRTDLKFIARDKALDLQADVLRNRLDSLNEWRQQNKDERQVFISRAEYDLKHQLLENKIEQLQKFMWITFGIISVLEFMFKFFIK